MFGYYYVMVFFIGVNIIGLICNVYLYYIDIKYNDGILNRVDKGETIVDLITSPAPDKSRKEILKESMSRSSQAR